MGIYNARGNIRVSEADTPLGSYMPDGAQRVTIVDGSTRVGMYAADGSLNIKVITAGTADVPLIHASGATHAVEAVAQKGVYDANNSLLIEIIP